MIGDVTGLGNIFCSIDQQISDRNHGKFHALNLYYECTTLSQINSVGGILGDYKKETAYGYLLIEGNIHKPDHYLNEWYK